MVSRVVQFRFTLNFHMVTCYEFKSLVELLGFATQSNFQLTLASVETSRCSSDPDKQMDRWTCLLGVCSYVLVTLEVVNQARN